MSRKNGSEKKPALKCIFDWNLYFFANTMSDMRSNGFLCLISVTADILLPGEDPAEDCQRSAPAQYDGTEDCQETSTTACSQYLLQHEQQQQVSINP